MRQTQLVDIVTAVIAALIGWVGRGVFGSAREALKRRRQQTSPLDYTFRSEVSAPWSVRSTSWLSDEGLPADFSDQDSLHTWATSAGAVDAYASVLRVTLLNQGPSRVSVYNLSAEIVARRPAISGYHYFYESAGIGDVAKMELDLDRAHPIAVNARNPELWDEWVPRPWFESQIIDLDVGEQQDISITARTQHNLVDWRIILDLRVGLNQRQLVVDNYGSPFQTTAAPDDTSHRININWAAAINNPDHLPPIVFLTEDPTS